VAVEASGRAVLVVHVEVDEGDVEELNRWYEEEHGPERMAMPGFVSMRRFASSEGGTRFLAIYELESAEAATSPEYMSQKQSEWAGQVQAKWKKWDRHVWVQISEATAAG
jgi:hypothetical protein